MPLHVSLKCGHGPCMSVILKGHIMKCNLRGVTLKKIQTKINYYTR